MALPPRYEPRTTTPRSTPLPLVPTVRVGNPIGDALQRAGAALDRGLDARERRQQQADEQARQDAMRREAQFAITDGIRLESEWQAYADEAIQKAPADGAGVLEQFDKDWKSVGSHIESSYKTQEGRERAQVMQARIYAATRDKLSTFTARTEAMAPREIGCR